uniref:NADH dehydrogenase subunit 6 n=1 Tax=Callista chinensis TaxID=990943 RepID=A0A889QIC9_9BIVA|nr:NADH dehydrogenase subunit 6 [Callista chinensis]QRE83915.1 NADH dehydrogenase subunit 6 [Callista chinensis]QWM94247.1 NADH dehydrogenase subunit 6 [Callista chinensis]
MVEMFVFFLLGIFFQFSVIYSHPLVLGMSLLLISVVMGIIILFYGPLFSFCIFMVTIAGVLVVFSYTISLVPFKGPNYDLEEENISGKPVNLSSLEWGEKVSNENWTFYPSSWMKWSSSKNGIITCFLSLALMCSGFMYSWLGGEELSSMVLNYSEVGYFTDDYSFVLVWAGVLLFFAMVFGMGVANRYEGALIQ